MTSAPARREPAAGVLEFGPFQLDVAGRALYCSGAFVSVTPKVFETLVLLLEEAGRVVTKEQIFTRVWPDAAVEEGNITNNISTLRKILNPYFEGEGPIATVARRGYRFTAGVRQRSGQANVAFQGAPPPAIVEPVAKKTPAARTARTLPTVAAVVACATLLAVPLQFRAAVPKAARRSVAVLPMKNLSGAQQTDWLSTALTETLGAELMSGGQLRLVSAENVARMQQQLAPPPGVGLSRRQRDEIGKNLGCDLILTGSYLTADGRIRLDIRLEDVASGEAVATVSTTRDQEALLDVVSLAGAELRSRLGLAPTLTGQTAPARAAVPSNLAAQRAYFQGLEALRLRDGPRAAEFLKQAVAADPEFALAHSALSNTWRLLGYDRRGAEAAKRAFELSSRLPREDRLGVEAQYYEATSNWPKAIAKYRSLFELFPDNVEHGLRLANVQQLGGKLEDSLRVVEQLRALPGPDSGDPRIDLVESTVADRLADLPRAARVAAQAAAKAQATHSRLLLARARTKQAIYANRMGQPDAALSHLAEARGIFEAFGETGGVADALRWEGVVLAQRGQVDEAERRFDAALKLSSRLDYVRLTAQIQLGLAGVARRRGALGPAKAAAEAALASAREAANDSAVAAALNDLGIVLRSQGDYAGARAKYEENARITRELSERANYASAVNNLAILDLALGRIEAARRQLEEILPTDRQIGNKGSIALRISNLGQVLRLQGDLAAAERLAVEECRIHEELKARTNLAACRLRLAQYRVERGQAADGRATLELVSASDLTTSPLSLARLVNLQLDAGAPDKAAAALAETRKVMQGRSASPDEQLPFEIAAARVEGVSGRAAAANARLARAQAEATRLGLVLLALEARLADAEISRNRAQAAQLARDAEQAGVALYAAKARAIASGGLVASSR